MSGAASCAPVTAVVVTYQSARTVGRTLEGARLCREAGLLDTIVVDNGSTDATADILRREASGIRVVLTGTNNGFGRGCNIGFAEVASPYTIFINPDAVVEPAAIRTMLQFMQQHPRVGIVGPAIICGDDGPQPTLQHTSACPTPGTILRGAIPGAGSRPELREIRPGSEPFRTGWVCGAVLMIRTELMKRLNGFDPRFFLYWEEIDLCKRAEATGSEIWALGTAVARHVVAASAQADDLRIGACIARHYFQSRYYYMAKHHGRLAAAAAEVGEFALIALRSALDVARGRGTGRLRPRMQAALLSMPEQAGIER